MRAGFRSQGRAATYIVETCFLAEEMKQVPSQVAKWSPRDRKLMLAYYTVKSEEAKRHQS